MSVDPPAGNGTIIRIGFTGYDWAMEEPEYRASKTRAAGENDFGMVVDVHGDQRASESTVLLCGNLLVRELRCARAARSVLDSD